MIEVFNVHGAETKTSLTAGPQGGSRVYVTVYRYNVERMYVKFNRDTFASGRSDAYVDSKHSVY